MTIADTPLAAFDPTDPDVLAERVPHEEMLAMRRTAPVSFVAQDEDARAGFPDHQGFWALSKHADVAAVSKNQTDFSTQANGVIMRHVGDRMIVCPPLVITPEEIDTMVERAWKSIDEAYEGAKADGLFKSA